MVSSPEFPIKSVQMKQDDKFFSRIVSKENSVANSSFRVYYGGVTGAIPFTWEIQPGTPKHKFSDSSLPPLTPPPSYYSNTPPHHEKPTKKTSRSKLFNTFFFKISLKKASGHVSSHAPPSSSQSFSSSHSSSSRTSGSRRRFLSFGSSFDDGMDEGHVYVGSSSPTSVYCFGISRRMIRI